MAFIDKIVFSANALFLLVVTKSLFGWVINTVKWIIEDFIDFRTLSSNLEADEEYLKVIDEIKFLFIANDSSVIGIGMESGIFQIIDVKKREIVFAREVHQSAITAGFFFNSTRNLLTGSSDTLVKYWNFEKKVVYLKYQKHYDTVEYINKVSWKDEKKDIYYDLIASADKRGIFLIWDLNTGETIHYFSTNPDSSYYLPSLNTKLLYTAFINDKTIYLESFNSNTQEKIKRIEQELIENTSISVENFPTIASHNKNKNRSIQPHYFHFSENGKYYLISQKNQRVLRVMNSEKRECVAKIDLPFQARDMIFTSEMNLIAVTNG